MESDIVQYVEKSGSIPLQIIKQYSYQTSCNIKNILFSLGFLKIVLISLEVFFV